MLHARADGAAESPSVVLMGSLAADLTMWDPQVPALVGSGFRVVRFDFRGHGASPTLAPPYTLDGFVDDLHGILDRFAIRRPHLVGLSLGGMVALAAALRGAREYASIVVASTRPDMPEPLASAWVERAREVRRDGIGAIADGTIERWFTAPYRRAHPEVIDRVRAMILRTKPEAYADCIDIVRANDLLDRLGQVRCPTLFLVGEEDSASPPSLMREMQRRVPGAQFESIRDAAHLPNIEQPGAFNRAVVEFLLARTRGTQY